MKKAALYCRISTLNHGQSVDLQLNDLRTLAGEVGELPVKKLKSQKVAARDGVLYSRRAEASTPPEN